MKIGGCIVASLIKNYTLHGPIPSEVIKDMCMHARTLHGTIVEHMEAEGAAEAAEGPELVAEQGNEVLGGGRIGGRRSISHSVRYVQEADVYVYHHLHARVQAGSIGAGHLYTNTHAHTQSSQTLDRLHHAAIESNCSMTPLCRAPHYTQQRKKGAMCRDQGNCIALQSMAHFPEQSSTCDTSAGVTC